MAVQARLWGDVLEDEVEKTAGGEQHDGAERRGKICQQVVAAQTGDRADGDQRHHEEQRAASAALPRRMQFAEGVEAFGQVLQADQERQQRSGGRSERDQAANGKGLTA